MSDVAPAVETTPAPPTAVEQAPPPAPDPPPAVDDEAALDAAIDKEGITISHAGEKVVPVGKIVAPLREKIRELKPFKEQADTLRAENEGLKAKLNEVGPLAEAFKAVAAAQPRHPQPPAADPEPDTDAVEFARQADLYDAQGQPDVAKARALLGLIDKRAEAKATAAAAPLVQQTLQQQASHMFERVKATKIGGIAPDPEIAKSLWARVAEQPGGLQSLTDPRQAAIITQLAIAQTIAAGKAQMPATAPAREPLPPPIPTEPAGGKAAAVPTLNAGDRKVAKDLGITEAEYAKRLSTMPWRK